MELLCNAIISSFLAGIISYVISSYVEKRNCHRNLLEPQISILGEALYSILAFSKTYHYTSQKAGASEASIQKWRKMAENQKNIIIDVRLKLRYPLDGIIDELKDFAVIASRGETFVENEEKFLNFYNLCNSLRNDLDAAILESYKTGKPISIRGRKRVRISCDKLVSFAKQNGIIHDVETEQEFVINE